MREKPQTQLALAELVARLRRAMRRAARASDPTNALSVAQLELLSCVAENPGIRPSRLARVLQLAPNSVTTLVNGLERAQLLTRRGGGADRRAVALSLTAAGEEAVRRWQVTNAAILGDALGHLDLGHQGLLKAAMPALDALVRAIDARADVSSSGRSPR